MTTTMLLPRSPTAAELDRLVETTDERALDRLLAEALTHLRTRRRARRAQLAALTRREHELQAQRLLLGSGLLHLR